MSDIEISCVVPTRGFSGHLLEAIRSLKNERLKQLIVVVDVEPDLFVEERARIVDEVGQLDISVEVVRNVEKAGVCGARNTGIKRCASEYVTFLDDDDLNIAGRMERCLGALGAASADLCACTTYIHSGPHGSCLVELLKKQTITSESMYDRNRFVNVASIVRTSIAVEVLFDESLPAANDYDFWVRCWFESKSVIYYRCACIVQRRLNSAGITSSRARKREGRRLFLLKHGQRMSWLQRARHRLTTAVKLAYPDPRATRWFSLLPTSRL